MVVHHLLKLLLAADVKAEPVPTLVWWQLDVFCFTLQIGHLMSWINS